MRAAPSRRPCRTRRAAALVRRGQRERKAGADAFLALDGGLATHGLGEAATDGEAETGAAVRTRVATVALHERLEYRLQPIAGDADAGVFDYEFGARGTAVGTHGPRFQFHVSAGRRELD